MIIPKIHLYYSYIFILLILISVNTSWAFQVQVSADKTSVTVGETVGFSCTPTGGSEPYYYSWDFDDVESYKNPSTIQNPSHTFEWVGTHFVWVIVTDDESNSERALLIVEVSIDSAPVVVNAVSDCGCDNTDSADCTGILDACINNNYDSVHGLRIEFPSGTYRFDTKINNTIINAIFINTHTTSKKISIVGAGVTRPILRFYNPSTVEDNSGNTWDAFIIFNGIANPISYLRLKNIVFEEDGTAGDHYVSQVLLGNIDITDQNKYVTVEDCDIKKFSMIGQLANTILKRCNVTGCGARMSGTGQEMMKLSTDCLTNRNYIADGDTGGTEDGHSHIWYNSGTSYWYIIDNYSDSSNATPGKLIMSLKNDIHHAEISGNMLRNIESIAIKLGAYDKQPYDVLISDNRIINAGTGVSVLSSLSNIMVENNHFSFINSYSTSTGPTITTCISGLDVSDVTIRNNVAGHSASGDDFYTCTFENCYPQRFCDVSLSNNLDDSSRYKPGDPAGWYDANGYLDPGEYEYTPPTVTSYQINNGDLTTNSTTVSLNMNVSDSGSGMGNLPRFPFKQAALMQFSDDGDIWHQVEPYNNSFTWTLPAGEGEKTVYARFRDVDGNWSQVVSDSIILSFEGGDINPPYTSNHSPAKGATGIDRNINITLHIGDNDIGVDIDAINMSIEGETVVPVITGNVADYLLSYTPATEFNYDQVVDVIISASDLAGNPMTDEYSFIIMSLPNNPPVLDPIGNKSIDENKNLTFTVNAFDADEDTLTYSATNLPQGATFTDQTFSWTPNYTQANEYSVTFRVTDINDGQDTETITITVNNVEVTAPNPNPEEDEDSESDDIQAAGCFLNTITN